MSDEDDDINPIGTVSGRMSAKNRNLSNPPRSYAVNHLIQSVAPGSEARVEAVVFWPPTPKTLEEVNEGTFKYIPLTISWTDWKEYGCPHCGGSKYKGSIFKAYMGTIAWKCSACENSCFVLVEGLTYSTLGFGDTRLHDVELIFPKLMEHPLKERSV